MDDDMMGKSIHLIEHSIIESSINSNTTVEEQNGQITGNSTFVCGVRKFLTEWARFIVNW